MRFPIHITLDIAALQMRNALAGKSRYPFVLMLEPLWTCNLACLGCSKERHTGKLKDCLSLETCLKAVDDCGAASVSICGGEPLLYPELAPLIEGIIQRSKHIYLCTNALLLDEKLFGRIPPHKRLTVNVHLDGNRATHDAICDREGVFDKALEMIQECKRRGYHTITNTTVFRDTEVSEVEGLCQRLADLDVDGMLLAPAYEYQTVDREIFMTEQEMETKFRKILSFSDKYRISSTPLYLEFVAGMRDYRCSPWSTVTFTPRGWKGPCYLIEQSFTFDWNEFWNGTDWDYWESRKDSRCRNCRMHSGFEASVVMDARKRPKDMLRLLRWNLDG